MCNHHSKSGICEAGINCHEGHLCFFCLKYGYKKVFTDKEEEKIKSFFNKNQDLTDDLADMEINERSAKDYSEED